MAQGIQHRHAADDGVSMPGFVCRSAAPGRTPLLRYYLDVTVAVGQAAHQAFFLVQVPWLPVDWSGFWGT